MLTFQNPLNAALSKLFEMRLQEDVRQQASVEILSGKSFDVALRHARAEVSRQNRQSGFESLDAENEEALQLHERIAAPEREDIECWRVAQLDDATEVMLAVLADGTAALGRARGVTQRRAQQVVKKSLEKIEQGQGDLFLGGEGAK